MKQYTYVRSLEWLLSDFHAAYFITSEAKHIKLKMELVKIESKKNAMSNAVKH